MFKLSVVVLNTIMEGTVSQISPLGPRSNFMQFKKIRFSKMFPGFWSSNKKEALNK